MGKIKITSKQLLLVEGKDEENFFNAMLKRINIHKVQVLNVGGKDKFRETFTLVSNLERFSEVYALGFIRDAEQNKANAAFSSICDVLKKYKLPTPKIKNNIKEENNKKTGIFIMPNNIDEGMLEDLCLKSIEKNPVMKCLNKYIECCLSHLPGKNINLPKAKIQAYLAISKPIVNNLGTAALKNFWNFEEECFSEIKQFLHNLFV